MLVCPRCHHLNVPSASSCELCGADLAGAESTAPKEETGEGNEKQGGLTAALLDALEHDHTKEGRARGEGPRARSYMLRPLPVPDDMPAPRMAAAALPQAARLKTATQPGSLEGGETESDGAGGAAPACPYCGTENPAGNRFCGGCGGRLPDLPIASAQPAMTGSAPAEAVRAGADTSVTLICINEDGSDGTRIPINNTDNVIGRESDPRFGSDAFLSPGHARLVVDGAGVWVEDLESLNGTFVRIRDAVGLNPNDCFLMGRQVLRLELFDHQINPKARSQDGTRYMGSPIPTGHFKLLQIGIGGVVQNVYCVPTAGAVLGRERGDITFPGDKFMSARHAQLTAADDGGVFLSDLNSSNGTWIRIASRHRLHNQDFIFLGQQLFRVQID